MITLEEIYKNLPPAAQTKINNLLNLLEPKIEKYLRGEKLEEKDEKFLSIELENINEVILESGGESIIFTDVNNFEQCAREFEQCVNWYKYIVSNEDTNSTKIDIEDERE